MRSNGLVAVYIIYGEREKKKHSEAVSVLPMCDRRAIITTTNATPIYTTLAIIPANPPHTMRRLMSVAEDVFVVAVVVNGVVLFIVPLIFYHNIYNIIYICDGRHDNAMQSMLAAMR
jgi:hypothetical protein